MQAVAIQEALGAVVVGIDHITVAVRDLEKSIRWYEQSLGFRLQQRRTVRGERTSMHTAIMTAGQAMVVLVQGGEPESQVSEFIEHNGEGVSHVALAVSDLDDAVDRVQKLGVAVLPRVEDSGIRQVFLESKAETGVRLELIERRGGCFGERSMLEMFRALESRRLY